MEFLTSLLPIRKSRPRPPTDTQLVGPRILLRMPDSDNWQVWRTLRDLSRDYLVPWEPQWPSNALSYHFYCSLLRRQWRDWRNGKAYAFAIFLHGGDHQLLIGGITLADIQYEEGQKGTVGYWIGKPYARQGYMTEALNLVCAFAFDTLHLQRVEASCLPHNEASKKVLRRTGFEEEGYAKAYLQINGKREDHLLWGRNNPSVKKETDFLH